MNSTWFANKGQIVQTLLTFLAVAIAAIKEWPAIWVFYAVTAFLGTCVTFVWRRTSSQPSESGGVIRTTMTWAGLEKNDAWFHEQRELYIFSKDGKRFFQERRGALFDRLIDSTKTTHVLIVHPQYPYIDAIATMDPHKAQNPRLQTEDCLSAVRVMQELAAEAQSRGIDITKRNTFSGYHLIPTYNATFGDKKAYINLYYSRPHRGNLVTLECETLDQVNIYNEFKNDLKEIIRDERTTSLWQFKGT